MPPSRARDISIQGILTIHIYKVTPPWNVKNVIDTIMLFTKLGFHIHPDKSVFILSQKLIFLGFVLDSNAMTVTPTGEKVQQILSVCATLLKTHIHIYTI